jgi:uncharacterized protein (TIGR02246 family)
MIFRWKTEKTAVEGVKGVPFMKITSITSLLAAAALAGCTSLPLAQAGASAARTETCKPTSEAEIAALFERWNRSLQTGDAHKVVANYAERSILLPTVSNKPRLTAAEKEDYFHHFLENAPTGRIDLRTVEIGCNTAVDAGLYTFAFAKTGTSVSGRYTFTYRWNGSEWLITSHHSSAMPER